MKDKAQVRPRQEIGMKKKKLLGVEVMGFRDVFRMARGAPSLT